MIFQENLKPLTYSSIRTRLAAVYSSKLKRDFSEDFPSVKNFIAMKINSTSSTNVEVEKKKFFN